MISLETFRKARELKEQGVITSKIFKECNISKSQYYKWCLMDEDTFLRHIKSRMENGINNYREFITSIISITPQINDTAIMYRCMEEFPEFDIPRMTFFRYVKKIREETGYVRKQRRLYGITEESLPGVEGQVDFGQFKMPTMYKTTIRVYFFCMVLSYSRMKFIYFSVDPFTTETACMAHDFAFKYFGGRPQSLLYDQDKLFLVSENFGDFILTEGFKDYVEKTGFTATFCHKHDPQTKAKVESTVHLVKQSFLTGKVFTGIDELNCSCVEWLDRFVNGDYHRITKKIPREMFKEEYKYLTKVEKVKHDNSTIVTIRKHNELCYKGNIYALPFDRDMAHTRVKVVEESGVLYVYKSYANEPFAKFEIIEGQGRVFSSHNVNPGDNDMYLFQINRFFGDNDETKDKYIANTIRSGNPKYLLQQNRRLARMCKFYTKEELIDGMKYCIRIKKCSVFELSSYLVYKLGVNRARVYLHTEELAHFTKRANAIREELKDGKH